MSHNKLLFFIKSNLNFVAFFLIFYLSGCSFSDQGKLYSFENPFVVSEGLGPAQACSSIEKLPIDWGTDLFVKDWSDLLKRYVTLDGEVRYSDWKNSLGDRSTLDQIFLKFIQKPMNESKSDQLARLINLYNVRTVQIIIDHYDSTLGSFESPLPGVRSIRNIENLDFSIWDQFPFTFEGGRATLNSLEKEHIMKFNEPRIHFAINCASKGCPQLLNTAFQGSQLQKQLDYVTCQFVNSGTQTIFDTTDPDVPVIFTSQIMDWYWNDFKLIYSDRLIFFAAWLNQKISPVTTSEILQKKNGRGVWSIEFDDYDWTLNELEN